MRAKQQAAEGKTKPRKLYVHELRQKLNFLLDQRATLTRAAMCKQAGIQPTALDRAVRAENSRAGIAAGDSRLGVGDQRKLGKFFGFPAVDPPGVDTCHSVEISG